MTSNEIFEKIAKLNRVIVNCNYGLESSYYGEGEEAKRLGGKFRQKIKEAHDERAILYERLVFYQD